MRRGGVCGCPFPARRRAEQHRDHLLAGDELAEGEGELLPRVVFVFVLSMLFVCFMGELLLGGAGQAHRCRRTRKTQIYIYVYTHTCTCTYTYTCIPIIHLYIYIYIYTCLRGFDRTVPKTAGRRRV